MGFLITTLWYHHPRITNSRTQLPSSKDQPDAQPSAGDSRSPTPIWMRYRAHLTGPKGKKSRRQRQLTRSLSDQGPPARRCADVIHVVPSWVGIKGKFPPKNGLTVLIDWPRIESANIRDALRFFGQVVDVRVRLSLADARANQAAFLDFLEQLFSVALGRAKFCNSLLFKSVYRGSGI